MRLKFLLGVCAIFLGGCSTFQQPAAYGGIAADGLTTAVALSLPNMVEANPLGYLTIPLRIAAIEYSQTLPKEEGVQIVHSIGAVSWGAAVSNILVIAGAANPIALAAGAGVMLAKWMAGEDERLYAQYCAAWITEKPGNTCTPFRRGREANAPKLNEALTPYSAGCDASSDRRNACGDGTLVPTHADSALSADALGPAKPNPGVSDRAVLMAASESTAELEEWVDGLPHTKQLHFRKEVVTGTARRSTGST